MVTASCVTLTFINIFPGELEETVAELEMCRRKLATLRSQKESAAAAPPTIVAGHLGVKTEGGDRVSGLDKVSREARELEAALEETKVQRSISHVCTVEGSRCKQKILH